MIKITDFIESGYFLSPFFKFYLGIDFVVFLMDKSDLDIYQNIVVTGENDTNDGTLSSNNNSLNNYSQICQICGVVLKIDANIHNISDANYRQLSNPFSLRDDIECAALLGGNVDPDMDISLSAMVSEIVGFERSTTTNCGDDDCIETSTKNYDPIFRKSIAPRSFYLCPTLINIADSSSNTHLPMNNDLMTGWSARINATSALFDMMSSNTNIDHPLCEECADQLLNQLDAQCKIIEKEHFDYTNLINKLNQQADNDVEIDQLESELKDLELEEKNLVNQLHNAELREEELLKEKEEKLNEEASLLQQEQIHLLEYSNYKRQLIKLEEKQESVDNLLRNTKFHFNRLRTVNVLNATFHIWHSGPFGTINYFRLGRLPDTPVEWEEINAGLGQVNLLLYCLARKVKLEFKRFRLVPFGNYSTIEVIEVCSTPHYSFKPGDELHMYRYKGLKYYFEWDGKFDLGMVAFLDCLQQFEEKIRSIDPQFSMPYRINGYKLEDKL
jgi:hypothetical protein